MELIDRFVLTEEKKRKIWFHASCMGLIGFIQIIAIGLILLSDMTLFARVTAFGPPFLLPLLILLPAVFTSLVYLTIYYLIKR